MQDFGIASSFANQRASRHLHRCETPGVVVVVEVPLLRGVAVVGVLDADAATVPDRKFG